MATMKQVAARAGVSISTVSHVINGTRAVREDVRKRVLAIIDEMRYVPSAVARSLRSDTTRLIGVILAEHAMHARAELVCGIEDAAFEAGYGILLCTGADGARLAAHLRTLIEKRIDGLVLVADSMHDDLPMLLGADPPPVVLADFQAAGVDADIVGFDHEAAADIAIRHLLELGHREIALAIGPEGTHAARAQLAGAARALGEAGVPRPAGQVHGESSCEGGYAAFRQLLALPAPPTAVFAGNDLIALGGLRAAVDAGVGVPRQLSVVGCGDIALSPYAVPRLTTVAQPQRRMGQVIAQTLFSRIGGALPPALRELLQGELILRESTAAPFFC
jgi:LacI family transcriptional regulator